MSEVNRFSRDRVLQILDRAAQIELREDLSLTETELQEIAREVGIDAKVLRRAIDEVGGAEEAVPMTHQPSPIGLLKAVPLRIPAMWTGLGTGVGFVAGAVRTIFGSSGIHLEAWLGLGIVAASSLYIALNSTGKSRHVLYQLSSLGMWLGFAVGFGLGFPILAGDSIGLGVVWATVSGVAGAILMEYRARRSNSNRSDELTSAPKPQSQHADSQHEHHSQRSAVEQVLTVLRLVAAK